MTGMICFAAPTSLSAYWPTVDDTHMSKTSGRMKIAASLVAAPTKKPPNKQKNNKKQKVGDQRNTEAGVPIGL